MDDVISNLPYDALKIYDCENCREYKNGCNGPEQASIAETQTAESYAATADKTYWQRAFEQGVPIAVIAKVFCVSVPTVKSTLKNAGLRIPDVREGHIIKHAWDEFIRSRANRYRIMGRLFDNGVSLGILESAFEMDRKQIGEGLRDLCYRIKAQKKEDD
jgi:hypothetical protein